MPSTSTATNASGIKIIFEEDTHRYYSVVDNKEIEYVSGTSFVSKYFTPFDEDKAAKISADKLGVSVEDVKAKWKQIRDEACRYGTRCHEVCEDVILGRAIRNTPENMKEELAFKNAKFVALGIKKKLDVVGIEKIVFDYDLKIAGTIDLLCKSKIHDNVYYIIDWKTNKKIETENKFNKFALPPISHLPDITLTHYQLQLNLYEYLLKHAKYIPKNATVHKLLFHITPTIVEKIKIENLQDEIDDMIFY